MFRDIAQYEGWLKNKYMTPGHRMYLYENDRKRMLRVSDEVVEQLYQLIRVKIPEEPYPFAKLYAFMAFVGEGVTFHRAAEDSQMGETTFRKFF